MRRLAGIFLVLICLLLAALPQGIVFAQNAGQPLVVVLKVDSAVTPVLYNYLERGLTIAKDDRADLVVIELDTPGGSVDTMNSIVQLIRASDIPVVVYVSPRNAMAASAGTVITLAGHLAAMAPETTIGAASPVGSQGEDIGTTMEAKVKEILKASVRGLTSRRSQRATTLAQEMIENARAVTAEEALDAGLIDYIALDLDDLLQQLDGRSVTIKDQTVLIHTTQARIREVGNTLIEQLLTFLINPNLVFILLSVGVQAILIEISSPGGWVAGFIGAICLILAVYGMGMLPVNWLGLLFFGLAFVLFVLDIKAPTHGALTVAGGVSFVVGALVLFNSVRMPGIPALSIPLVIGTALFIAVSFLVILTIALRAQKAPLQMGKEVIYEQTGYVEKELNPTGIVRASGEQWSAEAVAEEAPIPKGTKIEIVSVEGLTLKVRRLREGPNEPGA